MKRSFVIIWFIAIATLTVCASNPLKIGVITDTHYLSEQLMDKGYAVQDYVYKSGRDVMASPEILDKVIGDYLQSDIEVLLVCGDLTNDGEKQSHIDFRSKLKPLYDKGVKIFVIPGNHDVNIVTPVKYQGNKTFETEGTTVKDFEEIYAEYGYETAMERCPSSLSYVAELDGSTWLLAIDAVQNSPEQKRSSSAGTINPETEEWIKKMLFTADSLNKAVVAMMHWGVAEHIVMQSHFFKNYLVEDFKRISSLLADNGVKLIFTGHFHSNDITAFESESGNTIYDVETGSLISFPFAYRFVELDTDQAIIKTKNITSIPSNPELAESSKNDMKRLAVQRALPLLKKQNKIFSPEELEQFSEIAGELFVLHLAGDEEVPESIRNAIVDVFKKKGFPVDETLQNLEIDFPPLDNNVTIQF